MFALNFLKLALVFVAGASSSVSQTTVPANCTRTHTVQAGDTCDTICAQQHVSNFQLMTVNPFINTNCTNLVPGEVLCLGLQGQDCTSIHVVQEGDFCASIAAGAGISIGDLLFDNPNVNAVCSNIRVGEVLCVAPVVNGTTTAWA
ncbi:hypothetical protein CPC08DRAFT_709825 [Agrocybe pediades]|nr:hypothetical protein CPC08DRAFT_709825 [Agrocybe pediades]